MATAAQVCKAALQRILVQGSEAELAPDELQDAIFAMNNYMMALDADGITLGYTEVDSLDDVITIPPGALRGLIANLAIEIAPDYDGTVTPALAQAAAAGYEVMVKLGTGIGPTAFPGILPVGSGNEGSQAYNRSHFFDGASEADILAETTGAIAQESGTEGAI